MQAPASAAWPVRDSAAATQNSGTRELPTGWDFDNVWSICEGAGYPWLKWEHLSYQPGDPDNIGSLPQICAILRIFPHFLRFAADRM
jgi:hypothetical protein